jgi:superfamily II DNA/RNA helicase
MTTAVRHGATLGGRVASFEYAGSDALLEPFLDWVAEKGLELYPAQEEALLEIFAGRHVILGTPTGSGKSLVAVALHFKALCEGQRSFYSAPTKALVGEKFRALSEELGSERVGLLTGDISISRDAPVICCTTEVLANMALRGGESAVAPHVVMDEFHFYGDRERGVWWEVPLLTLPQTTFLLMSATLGDSSRLAAWLEKFTGQAVARVDSDERPVPLDFSYRETLMHETVGRLLEEGLAPVYIVNFTHRECGEQAQALTSANVSDRDHKKRISAAIENFRFDTPYGKELRRLLGHGVGVHHAGMLPRYRLLVEQLAQQGLVRVICGTDTLGVGVNIPIRTVVFAKLSKFDGEKVAILSGRDFRQIAGRAGRKGFDEQGSVVCQAPEHVIWNKRVDAKASRAGGRKKNLQKKSAPRGFVSWNEETFLKLVAKPPEPVGSRFRVTHGMFVFLLQREGAQANVPRGYRALIELIERSHRDARSKRRLVREAAAVFRSLRRAGILERVSDPDAGRGQFALKEGLQPDFSLYHTLSLYLVEAVEALEPESPEYALEVLSVVEAILDDPRHVLVQQEKRAKSELIARLKAEGVPYEDRIALLDDVTHPKPLADFVYPTFDEFARHHPWLGHENIRPKSVARDMFETYASFDSYVRTYGLARSEGVLLRYLGQVYDTLVKNVPEPAKTEAVHDAIAFFRIMLERIDASLLAEWKSVLSRKRPDRAAEAERETPYDLARDPKALRARIRAELHRLVGALAARDYEEAALLVKPDPDDPWDADRLERALAPYWEEFEEIVFTPRARQPQYTAVQPHGEGRWRVQQVIVDPDDDNLWCLRGEVELPARGEPEGPLFRLLDVGT